MSGGSHDYVCFKIDEYLCGQMHDRELNDLMRDVSKLAHDLEWADSGDYCREDYFKTVKKFKAKWFKGNRDERLRAYVDEAINDLQAELHLLIGADMREEQT